MNSKDEKGNWDLQKSKLKQMFAILTDDDLMLIEGKKDEMLSKIQTKIGKTKDEFIKLLESI